MKRTKRKEDGSGTEFHICLPGYEIPRWFTHQRSFTDQWSFTDPRPESSIIIELPPNWCNSRWMGFTLCVSLDAYKGPSIHYTDKYGVRSLVVALGEMPHSHYTTEIFLRVTSFWATCPHLDIVFVS
ncbi:hypothetical protein ACB092_11G048500 [Castanea dentata]